MSPIKPGKSRITFTTEDEFYDFLMEKCKKENRTMSNFVDTSLKSLFLDEYSEWEKTNQIND
ncbi:MAG: hypothetical protein ACRC1P_11065 [Cellulosilyticaceae bacterium]